MNRDASKPALRKYGAPPYSVALVHGGPGGAGAMAPVARDLSATFGVLEPLIFDRSLEGQIEKLTQLLADQAATPTTLIGHSYGAWLSVIVAARSPELVEKLILVSSGAFTAEGAADIEAVRRSRLSEQERLESERLGLAFQSASPEDKEQIWLRYGEICLKSDGYSIFDTPNEVLPGGAAVFQSVWPEVAVLRDSGQLLKIEILGSVSLLRPHFLDLDSRGLNENTGQNRDSWSYRRLSRRTCGRLVHSNCKICVV